MKGLLELLAPCPNAVADLGDNRDKYLFNHARAIGRRKAPTTLGGGGGGGGGPSHSHSAIVFLGMLIGMACRHNIKAPLSLPALLWKPLVGEAVSMGELLAVDCKTILSKELAALQLSKEALSELLVQALLSAVHQCADASASIINTSKEGVLLLGTPAPMRITLTYAKTLVNRALEDYSPAGLGLEGLALGGIAELIETIHRLVLLSQSTSLVSLHRGLSSVIPLELLPIFSPEEAEKMLCGESEVDIEVLKKATVYENVAASDRYIPSGVLYCPLLSLHVLF